MTSSGRNDPCPCGSGKKHKKCCLGRTTTKPAPAGPSVLQRQNPHRAKRSVIEGAPDSPETLFLQSRLAYQAGRYEAAAGLISRAICAEPGNPDFHNALGAINQALKKQGEAVACYQKALALAPDFAEAHYNLGDALKEQGRLEEAEVCQQRAKVIYRAGEHYNFGNDLKAQGRLNEAIENYRKALAIRPDYAEAHNNLGAALNDQGKSNEAAACYQNALAIKPDYAEAHNNLGVAFNALGRHDEAAACYQRALALVPDFVEACYNLGNAFKSRHKLNAAVENYRKALALKPDYAEAHHNLGNALKDQGNISEAIRSFRHALSLKPDFSEAYSSLLFLHAYQAFLAPGEYLALARAWGRVNVPEGARSMSCDRLLSHPPLAGRRLKVGYVSGDYWNHAVSYFVEPLFAHHDRTRVELFAYSNHGQRDAVTERLQALVEHWIPVSATPDTAVRDRIAADGIDVLVDLSGHTAHNRLGVFARRAAPVQAHYLGFFASTGLSEMDYWIGDATLTPPETDNHFSEQVWRLPRVWVCYDGKADAPPTAWRPDPGGAVWVGSFNNLAKLTPATLALWAEVLRALPEGKLLLKTKELADSGNRRRILDKMASHGIPASRIELLDSTATRDWAEHLARYDRLDIALDPVGGVGGGTTTCDALWMGVPVITLEGDRMASRMTVSMLDAIGHPEWVARSEAEYVEKVVALARDIKERKLLRASQRALMAASPLCDARGLAASLEDAYFEMFERWLKACGVKHEPRHS